MEALKHLKKSHYIAFVGGSDLKKQQEQMGEHIELFDLRFSENGLVASRNNVEFHRGSIGQFFGEERLKKFIKFALSYIVNLDIPIMRGTFIEYRSGLINISPIGRNCSPQERDDFEKYDKENGVRQKFIKVLQA